MNTPAKKEAHRRTEYMREFVHNLWMMNGMCKIKLANLWPALLFT